MIAGLPFVTWILMAAATLGGLALILAHYRIHSSAERRETGPRRGHSNDG